MRGLALTNEIHTEHTDRLTNGNENTDRFSTEVRRRAFGSVSVSSVVELLLWSRVATDEARKAFRDQ